MASSGILGESLGPSLREELQYKPHSFAAHRHAAFECESSVHVST